MLNETQLNATQRASAAMLVAVALALAAATVALGLSAAASKASLADEPPACATPDGTVKVFPPGA
jgi:hypothetical protein